MLDATGYAQAGDPFTPPAKAGPYLDEISRSPGKLRIAWSGETPSGRPLSPEVQAALERTAELLKGLGHEVVEEGLGIDYRLLYRSQTLVSASNFAASIRRWVDALGREPGEGEIEGLARRAYEGGKRISGEQALWGWQQLRLMNRQILERFERIDVYLTPVMSTPAPRVDWLDPLTDDLKEFDKRQSGTYGTTPPFNFTGQPSIVLPCGFSREGLPIGLQLVGKRWGEAKLLGVAKALEQLLPPCPLPPNYAA